ncbi:Oidioi.mRNA.OKI2018_I69.PAR.g9215.t1.cds [Oikopleura dioica]|uniref:Oidioi.mRNA.OKI2018_I69.PAR.g9215.t1.cds n=1 Tax=Oikopleura dioica TaxID=34765 RepID=A0ABN7RM84_OIKDI|nr:Oidioi.mRNA.OKI2018_I69.PAR.g9215.t1.cds [Oikopleura dioica]
MKLLPTFVFGAIVAQDYFDAEGERKKKKTKVTKSDACGCTEMPKNGPDAVATCVMNGGKRKTIDWTCPATGTTQRFSNIKCKGIRKRKLDEQCGDLVCNCRFEMDAFVSTMNPDEGQAVGLCTNPHKKPTYKLFCDANSDNIHDGGESFQEFRVRCRNGALFKSKFNQVLCGNSIIGGDGWEAGPASMPSGLTCADPTSPFTARRKRKIKDFATSKIVGGQTVDRKSTWPWIVKTPGCGGTIISANPSGTSDWILTAAHCCEGLSSMNVIVGSEDRSIGGASTDEEFRVTSLSIVMHPDYNGDLGSPSSPGADVCLVEVPNLSDAQPVGCVDCWKPACLPAAHVDDKRLCYVAGWGTTSSGGNSPTFLRDVGVHAFSQEACESIPDMSGGIVQDNEFCVGVPDFNGDGITDGGKDSCQDICLIECRREMIFSESQYLLGGVRSVQFMVLSRKEKSMEIICAGFPKTSSKSCSTCLRTLGFKVADYIETAEFLSEIWVEYINGRCSIHKVIEEYNKHGFQANQDIPGNLYWEELFHASPNAKVILTVRDSTEVWNRSMVNFMLQEAKRLGNPGFWLFHRFSSLGWTSPRMLNMLEIIEKVKNTMFFRAPDVKWFPADWRKFTWQSQNEMMGKYWESMKDKYEAQIRRVKEVVPEDRLLVWNIKEGWEPLCKFLDRPVPNSPIPHDNRTGDHEFMERYFLESDVGKEMKSYMKWYFAKFLLKTVIISGALIYEKKNDFRITRALVSSVRSKLNF